MGWKIKIGQGGTIRTQDRVVDIRVTEEFAHKEFVVTVQKPTQAERDQAKGRIDNAIIQIKRGSDIYIEGFIEDVELGQDIVKYSGRSFLVLLGYTTSSKTDGTSGATEAEYDDATGATIINDLINTFCVPNDAEITYTDVTFTETYGGEVKVHGKKVYDIVRNMCIDYSKDLWADATWNGDGINIDNKNIRVGTKSRGSAVTPHKTLYGGQHLKNIPTVKYRSSQNVINRIRVNGKGSGKEKVSVVVNDATSQTTYGVIEGSPYNNNMIVDEVTAEAVGQAIINAKKDLVEEVHLDLIIYISDLKYGDWVRISDSYSGVDTTQRIKKITRIYNSQQGESVNIEIGMPFDNYEMIIKDLTKGDVDEEPEMTKQGGALRLTANNPPGDWIRYDKGEWYDTTGTYQERGKGAVPFWTYANNPAIGAFMKALIQISDAGVVTYKVGTQEVTALAAEGTTVSVDALNTPLGEVILKGKSGSVGAYEVEDVYSSDDAGKSYIYRDVRPIIGSSSAGYGGGGLWEQVDVLNYTRLITPQPIDLQNESLFFYKSTVDVKIYRDGNDLILNPHTTADQVKFGGLLSADYGIENVLKIDMKVANTGIDMVYGNITNAGDITLFDNTSISPKLSLQVPHIESGGGVEMFATDNMFYINEIVGTILVQCTMDTVEWYFLGPIKTLGDININGNDLTNLDKIKAYFSTGVDVADSAGADKITLATTTYALEALANVNMNDKDIIKCVNIKGQTTGTDGANRLNIDFRGDGNHRLYYTGDADDRMKYETSSGGHLFSINSVDICQVHSAGINIASGKYIKSDSGDLEFRVPLAGDKIKFVVG